MSDLGPCKHCGRTIGDGDERRGWVHRGDNGYTGLSRCDPGESGLPYGYNAEPIGQPCQTPCIGMRYPDPKADLVHDATWEGDQ